MTDRCTCGFSVAVEYGFTPCYFEEQYFDIEIRCSDGTPAAAGKVQGGSSAYFTLPCEGVYSVTVSGPPKFSPRSQTKRVQCRRDCSNGATFIFSLLDVQPHPYPPKPEKPCRPKKPCHQEEPCYQERPCRPEKPCHQEESCYQERPCRPEKPCHQEESCYQEKPCRSEKICHELNIRCSCNGITIEQ